MVAGGLPIVVIGAGPAGLAAAYYLAKAGAPILVAEAHPTQVGGIAKTIDYKGYKIDIGGHRFHTNSELVNVFWRDILPADFLIRQRSSSILYKGKMFRYPLQLRDAFPKLGWCETARCLAGYLAKRLRPQCQPRTFEEWVELHFGSRLYQIFFKTYTEKVWGIPCSEIAAEWASQRINKLSLGVALRSMLPFPPRGGREGEVTRTLIRSFCYPRLGPGMLWDAAAQQIQDMGAQLKLGVKVVGLTREDQRGLWRVALRDASGKIHNETSAHVICSAPLSRLIAMLEPPPDKEVRDAAARLQYRDFIIVGLILKDRGLIEDQWIYVHDPGFAVGRIQNFKRWSNDMVPKPDMCCYGLEYFSNAGQELWRLNDQEIINKAKSELCRVLPIDPEEILDGCVIRQKKAYPVYTMSYQADVACIRRALEAHYPNLQVVGRNGMHRYNNQDHSVVTGYLAAQNILRGSNVFDPWKVNQDAEYVDGVECASEMSCSNYCSGGH